MNPAILLFQLAATVPGTYAIVVCTEPCTSSDSAVVVARGTLVLSATTPVDTSEWRRGCIELVVRRDHRSKMSPMSGPVAWRQKPGTDSVQVILVRGIDYGEELVAAVSGKDLVGRRRAYGFAARSEPQETMVASRTGPPESVHCKYDDVQRRSAWLGPLAFVAGSLIIVGAVFGTK